MRPYESRTTIPVAACRRFWARITERGALPLGRPPSSYSATTSSSTGSMKPQKARSVLVKSRSRVAVGVLALDRETGHPACLEQPRAGAETLSQGDVDGPDADRVAGGVDVPRRRDVRRARHPEAVSRLAEGEADADALVGPRVPGIALGDRVAHAVDDPLLVDLGDRLDDVGVLGEDQVDVPARGEAAYQRDLLGVGEVGVLVAAVVLDQHDVGPGGLGG